MIWFIGTLQKKSMMLNNMQLIFDENIKNLSFKVECVA